MDALVALRHDSFHPEEHRPFGCPIAAGTGAVFLAGKDDQRSSVGLVFLGGIKDGQLLAVFAPGAEIFGHPTLHTRHHEILDAHVREGATSHDAVIAASGAVAVEIVRLDAVLEQILARG